MPPLYRATVSSIRNWAEAELGHVGRIASLEDPDLQYAYAQSTVNGMLHLRDALVEMVKDPKYEHHREDLQRLHDSVVRVIKHLIDDYNVNLDDIKTFNTRDVLGDLSYLRNDRPNNRFAITNNNGNATPKTGGAKRKTRKQRHRRRTN
jgi:hypothetical protein